MKRILSVERLYTLGDYKNIKIVSTIQTTEDSPNNSEVARLLLQQLGVECDLAYQDYKQMNIEASKAEKEGQDIKGFLKQEHDKIEKELQEPLLGYTVEQEN